MAVALLVLVAWLITWSPAVAKDPADKITITGPGLTHPFENTDPGAVFDSWRGFIDWTGGLVTESPPAEQTYTVSFYLKCRSDLRGAVRTRPIGRTGSHLLPRPGGRSRATSDESTMNRCHRLRLPFVRATGRKGDT